MLVIENVFRLFPSSKPDADVVRDVMSKTIAGKLSWRTRAFSTFSSKHPQSHQDASVKIKRALLIEFLDIGARWSCAFPSTNGMILQMTRNLNINLKQCVPGRYRYTVQIYAFEKCGQGISVASSFMWNKKPALQNLIGILFYNIFLKPS